MKAIPYILYAAVASYIAYRVIKHDLETPPVEERRADFWEYDEATGQFFDPITHEEVFPEFD